TEQGAYLVGDDDDLGTPRTGPGAVRRVDAEDQLGTGRDGVGDLAGVETIDRDAEPAPPKLLDRPPDFGPTLTGVASDVDHGGPFRPEVLGGRDELVEREPRGVVDLGEDFDVVRPVTFALRPALPEKARKVAEVFGSENDGSPGHPFDVGQVAPTVA